jgi:hypothetical protein
MAAARCAALSARHPKFAGIEMHSAALHSQWRIAATGMIGRKRRLAMKTEREDLNATKRFARSGTRAEWLAAQ